MNSICILLYHFNIVYCCIISISSYIVWSLFHRRTYKNCLYCMLYIVTSILYQFCCMHMEVYLGRMIHTTHSNKSNPIRINLPCTIQSNKTSVGCWVPNEYNSNGVSCKGGPFQRNKISLLYISSIPLVGWSSNLAYFDPRPLLHLLHTLSASNNDLLSIDQARSGVVLSELSFETPPEIVFKRYTVTY